MVTFVRRRFRDVKFLKEKVLLKNSRKSEEPFYAKTGTNTLRVDMQNDFLSEIFKRQL